MKIGVIGEGETEYLAVPTLISKLGHSVVGTINLHGIGAGFPWDKLCCEKIYPYVRSFALKGQASRPDRVVVVLDREDRPDCCGGLATKAETLIGIELAKEGLSIPTSVVIANRQFECWLMADTNALDASPIMKNPISHLLGANVDEKNVLGIIKKNLKPGKGWDKPKYGKALAQKLDLRNSAILGRSRSLSKFVKEVNKTSG